jgi:hypothetical protein
MARIIPTEVYDYIEKNKTKDVEYLVNSMNNEEYFQVRLSTYKGGGLDSTTFSNLILTTENVFFADIDIDIADSDEQLEKANSESVNNSLEVIYQKILEVEKQEGLDFRVYLTYKGFRVIETTREYKLEDIDTFHLLRKLGSDTKYIQATYLRGEFAARLTPKSSRGSKEKKVAALLKTENNNTVNPKIAAVIRAHDSFVLNYTWSAYWRSTNVPIEIPSFENTFLELETGRGVSSYARHAAEKVKRIFNS